MTPEKITDNEDSDIYRLFVDIGELLLLLRMSKTEICEIAASALNSIKPRVTESKRKSPSDKSKDNLNLRLAAAAVFRWHKDKRFLTKDALPKPLPLSGPKSVETLIGICDQTANAKPIVLQLVKAKLLNEVGRKKYVPSAACLIPQATHPMAVARFVYQLRTMIWALIGNAAPGENGPLIEREASVRHLPERDIPAFRDFSRQQGAMFIQTIDEWLELRQAIHLNSKRKSRTSEVGAQVFAYIAK